MNSNNQKMSVIRQRTQNLATTISPLSSHFLSMTSFKLHHAVNGLLLLTAIVSPTWAFSTVPQPIRNNYAVSTELEGGNHIGYSRHVCLQASEDDSSNESNIEEDEDDEVDIITQKLRRNAQNGPINSCMKEHDKMMKENEDEANANVTGATLYSDMLANVIDPDFDPDVSADEEYVASQFKELLSRKGEELSRLGPGIATLPLDKSSNEAKSELELSKKEIELQQVVEEVKASGKVKWDESNLEESSRKQTEVLEKARRLQAEIDQLHVDDCGAVLLANLRFYEAFSLQDADGMKDVWWESPSVLCIHPSHPPLIGSNAVYESFAAMFENGMKDRARVRDRIKSAGSSGVYMTPTNIRGLSVRGTTASLVCDEEVWSRGSAGDDGSNRKGSLVNKLLTTNVFRKIGNEWKMTHRHASWHPTTTAAQEGLKAEPGIVLYDEENSTSNNISSKRKKPKAITLRKRNGDGTSTRRQGLPSIPSSLEGLDTNAIVGVPLPKEEEKKKDPKGSNEEGMIGKIINLSDLLGGGSSNDEKEEDKGIADALTDMLMGSGSDRTSTTGSGTPQDPFITKRVIKIGPEGIENLSKDTKPIDDDDEKDVVIDLRGKSDEERKEVLSNLVDNVIKDAGLPPSDAEDLKASALDATVSQTSRGENGLRQRCIATLRKLSDDGLLSPKQKRILLTDIITSSAKGENSMVEVAYELLCSDSEENTSGMEDFTEQCHVFASMGETRKAKQPVSRLSRFT